MQRLNLSNNQISDIRKYSFNGLINLKRLVLTVNPINKIKKNAFNGLSSLQELYLSNNQISKIKDNTFEGLCNLELLNLSHNPINEIKENVFNNLFIQIAQSNKLKQLICLRLPKIKIKKHKIFYAYENTNLSLKDKSICEAYFLELLKHQLERTNK